MPLEETVQSRMDVMSVKPEGGIEISPALQDVAKAGAAMMLYELKVPRTDYTIRLRPFAPDVQKQLDQEAAIETEIRGILQESQEAGPYSSPYERHQRLKDAHAALKTIPVEFQMIPKSHMEATKDEAIIGMYFLENPDLMETDKRLTKEALLFFYAAVAAGSVHDPEYKRLYDKGESGKAQEYLYQRAFNLLARTNYLPFQLKNEQTVKIDGLLYNVPPKAQ